MYVRIYMYVWPAPEKPKALGVAYVINSIRACIYLCIRAGASFGRRVPKTGIYPRNRPDLKTSKMNELRVAWASFGRDVLETGI